MFNIESGSVLSVSTDGKRALIIKSGCVASPWACRCCVPKWLRMDCMQSSGQSPGQLTELLLRPID